MSNFRIFYAFSFISLVGLSPQAFANNDDYSAQDLSNYTRSGRLSIIYGDGSAGGEPLEKLKESFENNSSDLSKFMDTAFGKGAEKVVSRYEESGRKITVPETEKFSKLDFFMADFFTRGSKKLGNSKRSIEYVLHRSEGFDSKIKKSLDKNNFESIYGPSVSEREMNPFVIKTKDDLDAYAKQQNLQYQVEGDLNNLLPIQFFDASKPVRFNNDNMVMLEIAGRLTIYNSIEEISEDDARRASKAYVSIENFHKLDQKLTGQEYKNLGADWMSKLMELFKASQKEPLKTSANDILNQLDLKACETL